MKTKIFYFILVVGIFVLAAGILLRKDNNNEVKINLPKQTQAPLASLVPPCVPTFLDGGGPYYQPNSPFRSSIVPKNNAGEKLSVSGVVVQSDCVTPVPNVVIDIWQANESGNYEDQWYRGRITTREDGSYAFETIVPKGYGAGTAYRPPHIHFKIWRGTTELITSQMFLPASRAQGIEDTYIMRVTTTTINGITSHVATHRIVLP